MVAVLDACSMIAYLRGEPGGDVVNSIISNPINRCYAHVVNLMEVYYEFWRADSPRRAESAISDLLSDHIFPRDDIDTAFWKSVGAVKAQHALAIGDCFAIALCQKLKGELVTSDHHEMDALASAGVCPILFIR